MRCTLHQTKTIAINCKFNSIVSALKSIFFFVEKECLSVIHIPFFLCFSSFIFFFACLVSIRPLNCTIKHQQLIQFLIFHFRSAVMDSYQRLSIVWTEGWLFVKVLQLILKCQIPERLFSPQTIAMANATMNNAHSLSFILLMTKNSFFFLSSSPTLCVCMCGFFLSHFLSLIRCNAKIATVDLPIYIYIYIFHVKIVDVVFQSNSADVSTAFSVLLLCFFFLLFLINPKPYDDDDQLFA